MPRHHRPQPLLTTHTHPSLSRPAHQPALAAAVPTLRLTLLASHDLISPHHNRSAFVGAAALGLQGRGRVSSVRRSSLYAGFCIF